MTIAPALAALLLAAQPAPVRSDFAVARDAFAEACADLSSVRVVERAVRDRGWQPFEPGEESVMGRYLAMARRGPDWRNVEFRPHRKTVEGRSLELLFFDVPGRGRIGDGLHCQIYMDEGRGFPVDEILRWSVSEPEDLGLLEVYWRPSLQWRPGVYPSHDITTVAFNPPGDPLTERTFGIGIEIFGLNKPPGSE